MENGDLFNTQPIESTPCDRYVRVAVESGLAQRDGVLTYSDPARQCSLGSLVTCPLGNRTARGVVVEVGDASLLGSVSATRAKPISSVELGGACLPPSLLELAEWISGYYICPLGMVLGSMVPAAVKQAIGVRAVRLLERSRSRHEAVKLTPSAARALERIDSLAESPFPIEARALARRLGLKNTGPITRLIRAGVLEETARERVQTSLPHRSHTDATCTDASPDLMPQQSHAIDGIASAIGGFSTHLLHGVTGSGKTEVYLQLIERAVDMGRSAIVLVPEIALTPQTTRRFARRLGHLGVAVLHSGLTQAERHRQWRRTLDGDVRVVVGARSAVFAPLDNVGVIVVDEEHDGSYKQDQLPRYHARDVAIVRAKLEGAVTVLGSATPSLESWHNATQGRTTLWSMPDRVGQHAMPAVELVNTLEEPRGPGGQLPSIGSRLAHALTETLQAGGQAIILQNRRGYAGAIACRKPTCGWRLQCNSCDASMVLHRGRALPRGSLVRCHHCLAEQLSPSVCPGCGGPTTMLGIGTQRVEDELSSRFDLEIGEDLVRVDADTMRTGRDYASILERFGRGDIRVMLGTQMIAKGLDFPNVRLVGVISADTGLSIPDFRASERTFQLVSQVAGRAGRSSVPGVVIVQTLHPSDPAIALAAAHDYPAFADRELQIRTQAKLPPAVRMARIVCRDRVEAKASSRAAELAMALRHTGLARVDAPGPCPIARIAEHYRYEIIISADSAGSIRSALQALRDAGLAMSDARTAIDVDPTSLL